MHRLCGCHRQDVQAPQYAETPRPSRPSPAPTHAAQLETGDPAATHVSAFSEVMGPLPVHVSEATPAGRCARSAKRDAASRRSSVSSRRLWGAHSSVVAGGHGHGGSARLSEPCGKGIAGSRPSGRSLSGNAIVARVARLGAGAPLSLGASTSNELLGAAEIRTPAFRRSARARGIVRPVAATSVPAGWGPARASTRKHASRPGDARARIRGRASALRHGLDDSG